MDEFSFYTRIGMFLYQLAKLIGVLIGLYFAFLIASAIV
jgi:hypothetical protein